jgi:BlaI family penicillinase repressor
MAGDVTGELGKRERQIMEIIYRRGSATASEVLADLPDRPSYSSVRGMLRYLEGKELLRHEREGLRYVYSPTSSKKEVRQSVLSNVVKTFFDDSVGSAVATLLESKRLTQAEYDQLKSLLNKLPKGDER